MNVASSVAIVFVNKVLMDPVWGYKFVFGEALLLHPPSHTHLTYMQTPTGCRSRLCSDVPVLPAFLRELLGGVDLLGDGHGHPRPDPAERWVGRGGCTPGLYCLEAWGTWVGGGDLIGSPGHTAGICTHASSHTRTPYALNPKP